MGLFSSSSTTPTPYEDHVRAWRCHLWELVQKAQDPNYEPGVIEVRCVGFVDHCVVRSNY